MKVAKKDVTHIPFAKISKVNDQLVLLHTLDQNSALRIHPQNEGNPYNWGKNFWG